MWSIHLAIGRVSGGEPELGPDAGDPGRNERMWGKSFLGQHRGLKDHLVSSEGLGTGKDHKLLNWMGGEDGKTWWVGLKVPCVCHPCQRALQPILQAVGNGKKLKPVLSYLQSLDNLTVCLMYDSFLSVFKSL